MAEGASVNAVAGRMRLSWNAVDGIMQRAVARGLARRKTEAVGRLSVDETSFRRRHRYVTVVSNPETGHVLHVAPGRGKDVLMAFYEGMGEKYRAAVDSVSMDMWGNLFTDCNPAYGGLSGFDHESVKHSAGEFVRGVIHTNGIESFWSLLKRGYVGVFHYMSVKHLFRYVNEFSGRENAGHNTMAGIDRIIAGAEGRRLDYRSLTR